jgi:hypothetical protein
VVVVVVVIMVLSQELMEPQVPIPQEIKVVLAVRVVEVPSSKKLH